MPPLKCRIERAADETFATLSGEITEDSHWTELLGAAATRLRLDLSGIRRINSPGVREWLLFVGELERRRVGLVLDRCSVAVVHQLNIVPRFRGGGEVRSVFAPYFCTACNAEHHQLLAMNAERVAVDESLPCPTCGESMEFDDLPEHYLAFRTDENGVTPTPA